MIGFKDESDYETLLLDESVIEYNYVTKVCPVKLVWSDENQGVLESALFMQENPMVIASLFFNEKKYGVQFEKHLEYYIMKDRGVETIIPTYMFYYASLALVEGKSVIESMMDALMSDPIPVPEGWEYAVDGHNGQAKLLVHEMVMMEGIVDNPLVILGSGGEKIQSGSHYLPLFEYLDSIENKSDIVLVDPGNVGTFETDINGRRVYVVQDVAKVVQEQEKVVVNGYKCEHPPVLISDVWSKDNDQYKVHEMMDMVADKCKRVSYKICDNYDFTFNSIEYGRGQVINFPFIHSEQRQILGEVNVDASVSNMSRCNCKGCSVLFNLLRRCKQLHYFRRWSAMVGLHVKRYNSMKMMATVFGYYITGKTGGRDLPNSVSQWRDLARATPLPGRIIVGKKREEMTYDRGKVVESSVRAYWVKRYVTDFDRITREILLELQDLPEITKVPYYSYGMRGRAKREEFEDMNKRFGMSLDVYRKIHADFREAKSNEALVKIFTEERLSRAVRELMPYLGRRIGFDLLSYRKYEATYDVIQRRRRNST
jgi:hypothetical protein